MMYRAKISSAREMIYEKNLAVDSAAVQRLLTEANADLNSTEFIFGKTFWLRI
jgi:hypothetical protein